MAKIRKIRREEWGGRIVAMSSCGASVRARIAVSTRWHEASGPGARDAVLSSVAAERMSLGLDFARWARGVS